MNKAQRTIVKFVKQHYPTATWEPVDPAAIKITTDTGDVMTLGVNLYGDIMRGDKIIARGNTDHSFESAGYIMPTEWTIL